MGSETEKQGFEKRENLLEYCVLQFTHSVSGSLSRYIVNQRAVLTEPDELLRLKLKQNKATADRHPLGTEYDERFLTKAKANNGSFGLIDAIEVLTEDGWEPILTDRVNQYDSFILFKRTK